MKPMHFLMEMRQFVRVSCMYWMVVLEPIAIWPLCEIENHRDFFLRLLLSPEKLVFHIFPSESECSHNYIQTQMWADKYTNTNRYTLASTQLSSQVRHLTPQSQDAEFPVPMWNLLLSFIIHDRVNKKDSRLLFGVRIIQSDGKYMCGHTISTLYSNG